MTRTSAESQGAFALAVATLAVTTLVAALAVETDCPHSIVAQTVKDHNTDYVSSPLGNDSVQQYPFVNLPMDRPCDASQLSDSSSAFILNLANLLHS